MTYFICDIETLGTKPRSVITEIGGFFFREDPDARDGYTQIGNAIWCHISILSCLEHRLLIDEDTVLHRSKNGTLPAWDHGYKLPDAIATFNNYLADEVREHRIDTRDLTAITWGLDFDFPLIRSAAAAVHIPLHQPWHYGNQLCARSIWKQAFGKERAPTRTHYALQDCLDEARDFCKARTYLRHALGHAYPTTH